MGDGKRAMASERILEALEPVSVSGDLPGTVAGLSHDSRHVGPGDWFFALAGQHADGARFASAALAKGAGAVVTEAPTGQTPEVRVIDARRSMARAAARFYGDAFTADPRLARDVPAGTRYNAACSAALAGCGQGKDADGLDDKERARWRRQALQWLRQDLAWWVKALDNGNVQTDAQVLQGLRHWQIDPDLAGLRDPGALD